MDLPVEKQNKTKQNKYLFCPYKMYDVGNANKSNLASG
jgi:hypothetical protein